MQFSGRKNGINDIWCADKRFEEAFKCFSSVSIFGKYYTMDKIIYLIYYLYFTFICYFIKGLIYVDKYVFDDTDLPAGTPIGLFRARSVLVTKINGQDFVFGVHSFYCRNSPRYYKTG